MTQIRERWDQAVNSTPIASIDMVILSYGTMSAGLGTCTRGLATPRFLGTSIWTAPDLERDVEGIRWVFLVSFREHRKV